MSSKTRVVIVGAGGQGRIVADILLAGAAASGLVPVGFVDDDAGRIGAVILGLTVQATTRDLRDVDHDAIVVAIGDNALRQCISLALVAQGERIVTVAHPVGSVGHDVVVGRGSMLSAGAVVTPCVRIGRGVLVNTRASIDHESVVDDFAHVSAGATVGACVTIGARTLVGLGATVMSRCRVGADTIVGAGALVVRDLPDGVVAMGVPARVIRRTT